MVLGEALIDLLPSADGTLVGHPGGSPANAAVALSRLGLDVTFLGGLSTDRWGRMLVEHFAANQVAVSTTPIERATALAICELADDGAATYRFLWDDTADLAVTIDDLPRDLGDVAAVVVGSVNAVAPGVGQTVMELVQRESANRVVVLDPNLRPAVTPDLDRVRAHLLEMATYAHIVKASDEDLAVLLPDLDPDEAAFQLLDGEMTQLVVVTRGAKGAWVTTPRFQIPIPAGPVEAVVDTVAAGDTFTAGLLTALTERGLLPRHALRRLSPADATDDVGVLAGRSLGGGERSSVMRDRSRRLRRYAGPAGLRSGGCTERYHR